MRRLVVVEARGTPAFVDRLRELGAPRVLLFTADRNHGAQAMFDRAGFRRTMI